MYYEDPELSLRCWRAGLRVVFVPDAVVAAPLRGRPATRQKMYLVERNRLIAMVTLLEARTLVLLAPAAARRRARDARTRVAAGLGAGEGPRLVVAGAHHRDWLRARAPAARGRARRRWPTRVIAASPRHAHARTPTSSSPPRSLRCDPRSPRTGPSSAGACGERVTEIHGAASPGRGRRPRRRRTHHGRAAQRPRDRVATGRARRRPRRQRLDRRRRRPGDRRAPGGAPPAPVRQPRVRRRLQRRHAGPDRRGPRCPGQQRRHRGSRLARAARCRARTRIPRWVRRARRSCSPPPVASTTWGWSWASGGEGWTGATDAPDDGAYDRPAEVFAWCGAAVLLRGAYLDDVGPVRRAALPLLRGSRARVARPGAGVALPHRARIGRAPPPRRDGRRRLALPAALQPPQRVARRAAPRAAADQRRSRHPLARRPGSLGRHRSRGCPRPRPTPSRGSSGSPRPWCAPRADDRRTVARGGTAQRSGITSS